MITAILLTAALTAEQVDTCRDMGKLASTVMEVRHLGAPRSAFEAGVAETGAKLQFFTDMIDQAYAETRWHTEGSRTRAIEDFRDHFEAYCFTLFGETNQ